MSEVILLQATGRLTLHINFELGWGCR